MQALENEQLSLGSEISIHLNSRQFVEPGELDLSENPLGAAGAKELAKILSFSAASDDVRLINAHG